MRLRCHKCGKSASTEVPEGTVVRAILICPECIEKEMLNEEEHQVILDCLNLRQDLIQCAGIFMDRTPAAKGGQPWRPSMEQLSLVLQIEGIKKRVANL